MATAAKPVSVSFDAALHKTTKSFNIFNEPQDDAGGPKGIVYLPKKEAEKLKGAKSVTITVTAND